MWTDPYHLSRISSFNVPEGDEVLLSSRDFSDEVREGACESCKNRKHCQMRPNQGTSEKPPRGASTGDLFTERERESPRHRTALCKAPHDMTPLDESRHGAPESVSQCFHHLA